MHAACRLETIEVCLHARTVLHVEVHGEMTAVVMAVQGCVARQMVATDMKRTLHLYGMCWAG